MTNSWFCEKLFDRNIYFTNDKSLIAQHGLSQEQLKHIEGMISVRREDQIDEVVNLANELKVKLMVINNHNEIKSLRFNSETPCFILNLSWLKKIFISGSSAIIESGVTQSDLVRELEYQNIILGKSYEAPGYWYDHQGSIIGHIFNSGCGPIGQSEYIQSVDYITGVWGNGIAFNSQNDEHGDCWNSLLLKSDLGVIKCAAIKLNETNKNKQILVFSWKTDKKFAKALPAISKIEANYPCIKGVFIANGARLFAALEEDGVQKLIQESSIEGGEEKLLRKHSVNKWNAFIVVEGKSNIIRTISEDMLYNMAPCKYTRFDHFEAKLGRFIAKKMHDRVFSRLRKSAFFKCGLAGILTGYSNALNIKFAAQEKLDSTTVSMSNPVGNESNLLWVESKAYSVSALTISNLNDIYGIIRQEGLCPMISLEINNGRMIIKNPIYYDAGSNESLFLAKKSLEKVEKVIQDIVSSYAPNEIGFSAGKKTNTKKFLKVCFDKNHVLIGSRHQFGFDKGELKDKPSWLNS